MRLLQDMLPRSFTDLGSEVTPAQHAAFCEILREAWPQAQVILRDSTGTSDVRAAVYVPLEDEDARKLFLDVARGVRRHSKTDLSWLALAHRRIARFMKFEKE